MKKIAVTGANGKVGQYVIDELLAHGYEVRAIDREPPDRNDVESMVADVTVMDEMQYALDQCNGLIHLAAIPSPRKGQDSFVYETNTMGVFNTLLAAGQAGIRHASIASSDCAFGFTYAIQETRPLYVPIDEAHPAKPDNCYGLSKLVGEQVADAMAKRFNMSIASLRITYVARPEEYKQKQFDSPAVDDPEQAKFNLWSYIDARDCARAFRLGMETNVGGHDVFSITATNTRCTVPTNQLVAQYYPEAEIVRPFNGNESLQNCEKAASLLGFRPKYRWDQ